MLYSYIGQRFWIISPDLTLFNKCGFIIFYNVQGKCYIAIDIVLKFFIHTKYEKYKLEQN